MAWMAAPIVVLLMNQKRQDAEDYDPETDPFAMDGDGFMLGFAIGLVLLAFVIGGVIMLAVMGIL